MKTIRRLIHREALFAVSFVTAGFLALFFFFDLVDELRWVGRTGADGYQLSHAFLFVVLSIPSHLYELLPITVLIGTIFVMARLAQSSEFTIMRTSGMGPWRALRTLLTLGGFFVLLTFAGFQQHFLQSRAGRGRQRASIAAWWLCFRVYQRRQCLGGMPFQVLGKPVVCAAHQGNPVQCRRGIGRTDASTELAPRQASGRQGVPQHLRNLKPMLGLGQVCGHGQAMQRQQTQQPCRIGRGHVCCCAARGGPGFA